MNSRTGKQQIYARFRLRGNGHTHSSATYRIGNAKRYVRDVCNPSGISHGWPTGDIENPRFAAGL